MEYFDIYKDIADRTQGDIYIGVVGPVRTGKSTFIKRFMDLMVIPNIENSYKKQRAKDELPQSSSGKSIHTTEPKFVPNEAVEIVLKDGISFKVRMVDCVGYIIKNAKGYMDGENAKMVSTPWYDYEIPFQEAAELGTKKVINEHSTIGIVVTTDGSITDIPREDYAEAEYRVVSELKSINKPFIIILNTTKLTDVSTLVLKEELEEKYRVPVQPLDVMNMTEKDIVITMEKILKEFNVQEINIEMPEWIEKLSADHWVKMNYLSLIRDLAKNITKVRDVNSSLETINKNQFIETPGIMDLRMGEGTLKIMLNPKPEVLFLIISEICNSKIEDEFSLLESLRSLSASKLEYDKISEALKSVRDTGYGMVSPQLSEMTLEEPEIVKQGNKYGVKLKASAPSLHFIKANIETEISPIMGTESETEELVKSLLEQFENDPSKIWQSNLFGKTLEVLVKEGLQNKLYKMPEDVQCKIQRTLQKIINEGNGGLICIIL